MSEEKNYNVLTAETGMPIKAWTKGVQLEDQARKQLLNVGESAPRLAALSRRRVPSSRRPSVWTSVAA
jgi:hypothetical protein